MRRKEQDDLVADMPSFLGDGSFVSAGDEDGLQRVEPADNKELLEELPTSIFTDLPGNAGHRVAHTQNTQLNRTVGKNIILGG